MNRAVIKKRGLLKGWCGHWDIGHGQTITGEILVGKKVIETQKQRGEEREKKMRAWESQIFYCQVRKTNKSEASKSLIPTERRQEIFNPLTDGALGQGERALTTRLRGRGGTPSTMLTREPCLRGFHGRT